MEKERGEVTPTKVNIEQISTLGSKAPAIPQGGNGGEEAERAKEPEPVLNAGGTSKKLLPCESVARVDKGKMVQCMEEKMDSFSGATDSVNGELEAASSSTNEGLTGDKTGWSKTQVQLDIDPGNGRLRDKERQQAVAYFSLCREEEAFYKQRSRVQWLALGDRNTKFFHCSLIHRNVRNSIGRLVDDSGLVHTGNQEMGDQAVSHFKKFLRTSSEQYEGDIGRLYSRSISEDSQTALQMLPRVPCVLCGVHEEDHNHLFFNCTLSNAVWRMLSLKLHVTWPTVPWLQAWQWACDGYASRSQHHSHVLGMALAAIVYHLWSERNQRLHHQQHGSVQKLWENICGSVRDRLANLNEVCLLPESIRRQWDIH
ncbi:hypothetical protein OIU74_015156 [Salix koriyanagi]|uniref:Reverse transcriptase zinc-binding domain-containing protein n=1 Tax=Salix koriyanagi TaxID=2511006 RepID=A0A9Q0T077_9ROSI|nr:hypothetical protein OIU74_015156 [Salix koriyanagi]